MKNEITVEEVRRCKKELEEILLARIKAFEMETGCSVKSIDFSYNQIIGGSFEAYSLSVDCRL